MIREIAVHLFYKKENRFYSTKEHRIKEDSRSLQYHPCFKNSQQSELQGTKLKDYVI